MTWMLYRQSARRSESYVAFVEAVDAVAEFSGVPRSVILERTNAAMSVAPRQLLWYICHTVHGISLPVIGKLSGGWHHTTVLHGVQRVAEERQRHADLDAFLRGLAAARVA